MTYRQRQLVRESFPEIRGMAGPLSLLFYGRLFELAPSVRPMFRQEIEVQGRKLMDTLSVVVEHVDELDRLTPVLHAMGQRHTAYGVKPEHYAIVSKALIWALGQALGEAFDAELKGAWVGLIDGVSAVMKEGAAQLSPS
jgi:hemoglobin-like flavoprotein